MEPAEASNKLRKRFEGCRIVAGRRISKRVRKPRPKPSPLPMPLTGEVKGALTETDELKRLAAAEMGQDVEATSKTKTMSMTEKEKLEAVERGDQVFEYTSKGEGHSVDPREIHRLWTATHAVFKEMLRAAKESGNLSVTDVEMREMMMNSKNAAVPVMRRFNDLSPNGFISATNREMMEDRHYRLRERMVAAASDLFDGKITEEAYEKAAEDLMYKAHTRRATSETYEKPMVGQVGRGESNGTAVDTTDLSRRERRRLNKMYKR